jgi:hypothetical protein
VVFHKEGSRKICVCLLVLSTIRNTNKEEIVLSIVYEGRYFPNTIFTRVGTKTLFSLFAKTKTLTKSVTVFAKFRHFFAKGFRENPNLTKDGIK